MKACISLISHVPGGLAMRITCILSPVILRALNNQTRSTTHRTQSVERIPRKRKLKKEGQDE